jgi:hypothetical protein
MTLTEKTAYLRGLADGLNLSKETAEGKVLHAVIDCLESTALSLADVEDTVALLGRELDDLYDDLYDDNDEYDDEEDSYDDEDFEDEDLFEVTCGKCNEKLYFGFPELEKGSIVCPACSENLEFDIPSCECNCEDDEDDCECVHQGDEE